MTGSDDGTPSDEHPGSEGRRRTFVGTAEPTPVTEAMITPRTTPPGPEEVEEMEFRFCPTCGERSEPGGSYCLACGVRFAGRGAPAGRDESREESVAPERTRDRPVAGVTELPTPYWNEGEEPPGAAPPVTGAQRRFRFLLIMIVVIAILFLGFNTLRSRDEEQTESSTTTSTAPDDSVLRSYVDQISVLADGVAELKATGRRINDAWDDRIADYDTTLDRMNALVSRAGVLPDRLSVMEPPEGADTVAHQRMIGSLSTLASAAEGMMTGLESSDSGEARLSQLTRFEASASEFGRLAEQVKRSMESRSPAVGGQENPDQ